MSVSQNDVLLPGLQQYRIILSAGKKLTRFTKSVHFRTSFKLAPSINGKEIDLYLLYWLVTAQGGWERVRIF